MIIATFLVGDLIILTNAAFYAVVGIALYILATRYSDYPHAWIIIIIIGIFTLIWTLKPLGLVIAILLIVAGNDMKKELD